MYPPFEDKKTGGRSWLRFFGAGLLFILIFCYPWELQKNWQGGTYVLAPDTVTYIGFTAWKDPWQSGRSIGYPAFIYPFLYPDQQKFIKTVFTALDSGTNIWASPEPPIYTIATEVGIGKKFDTIVLVQRLILPLAIAVFYLSLCRWFHPVFSFLALCGAFWLAPPPNPHWILTEPLSCALTWLCGAFLLYAPTSTRKSLYYALACLCAACAFLVRPQTLSLIAICSLIFVYEIIFSRNGRLRVALLRKAVAFSPLLLAYGYIAWISVTGGGLHLHTLSDVYYSAFNAYAEAEDAEYMPSERSRKFTAWFGEHKKELIGVAETRGGRIPEDASPPRRRLLIGDGLLYRGGMGATITKFANTKDLAHRPRLSQAVFGKELVAGLQKRHRVEILVARWKNFLGALGYYKDVYKLHHFSNATLIINIMALFIASAAIITKVQIRWPLIMMTGIHIMAILVPSFGHIVISRYVEPTEPFLLLAGMCALWAFFRERFVRSKSPCAQ